MCRKYFHFCRDCNGFYPSKKKVKVSKEECDGSNCKGFERVLIDTRHKGCKQIKKSWKPGKHTDPEPVPMSSDASKKIDKLEIRRVAKHGKVTPSHDPSVEDDEYDNESYEWAVKQVQMQPAIESDDETCSAKNLRIQKRWAVRKPENEFWDGVEVLDTPDRNLIGKLAYEAGKNAARIKNTFSDVFRGDRKNEDDETVPLLADQAKV